MAVSKQSGVMCTAPRCGTWYAGRKDGDRCGDWSRPWQTEYCRGVLRPWFDSWEALRKG